MSLQIFSLLYFIFTWLSFQGPESCNTEIHFSLCSEEEQLIPLTLLFLCLYTIDNVSQSPHWSEGRIYNTHVCQVTFKHLLPIPENKYIHTHSSISVLRLSIKHQHQHGQIFCKEGRHKEERVNSSMDIILTKYSSCYYKNSVKTELSFCNSQCYGCVLNLLQGAWVDRGDTIGKIFVIICFMFQAIWISSIVQLGPSPNPKLEEKGLDQSRTLTSH
jgi:hypothetical protein